MDVCCHTPSKVRSIKEYLMCTGFSGLFRKKHHKDFDIYTQVYATLGDKKENRNMTGIW